MKEQPRKSCLDICSTSNPVPVTICPAISSPTISEEVESIQNRSNERIGLLEEEFPIAVKIERPDYDLRDEECEALDFYYAEAPYDSDSFETESEIDEQESSDKISRSNSTVRQDLDLVPPINTDHNTTEDDTVLEAHTVGDELQELQEREEEVIVHVNNLGQGQEEWYEDGVLSGSYHSVIIPESSSARE